MLKKSCLFFLIPLISCSSQIEWYRQLPPHDLPSAKIPLGKYSKKIFSKAPLNSRYLFHENKEEILLLPQMQFTRMYVSKWTEGNLEKETRIFAKGYYQNKGAWVLLTTTQIHYEFFENNFKIKERKVVDARHRLLYYLWKKEKALIPMIYETGYEEKNFGVKDGVSIPYEENSIFYRYLRFYVYEEYQSHGYFLIEEEK